MAGTTFGEYVEAYVNDVKPDKFAAVYSWESPYAALRGTTEVATMRANGTFFTGELLASLLWTSELEDLQSGAVVFDPAAGAGDLLLPVAFWARENSLALTIRVNDVEPSFTTIAMKRLRAAAGPKSILESQEGDFLSSSISLEDVTHVALNPPFISVEIDCEWASGRVNAAAVFVDETLNRLPVGAVLLAILPDVLRSGSRYERWRNRVERHGRVIEVRPQGVFDENTDVHVFLLKVVVGATGKSAAWVARSAGDQTLGDICDVRVGPVVPHRDLEEGPILPFVTARNLTSGEQHWRRFHGRAETGPMVLVNRTSRPGDRPRVRARRRDDTSAAAIENHLLIVKPKLDSGVNLGQILETLASEETAEFLDQRIRTRHLTVAALKEVPWQT